jgi:beta-lactamase class A
VNSLPQPVVSCFFYTIRLIIGGIGLGTLAGTAISAINPDQYTSSNLNSSPTQLVSSSSVSSNQNSTVPYTDTLGEELTLLENKLKELAKKYPELEATAFFVDADNNAYVNFQGNQVVSAASTIKIPILVAFFQDVDAGKIYLDEMLTLTDNNKAGGSGKMQYYKTGSQFSALEVATKMIVVSDNSATNMLIERLGGAEALNERFRSFGLKSTAIRNPLPDLEGTNTTSSEDLVYLLSQVNEGKLISMRSRDRLLNIMTATENRSLLPQGLEKDATIAHKTGDIGSVLADAGIIDLPNGKRYIGGVMVKRPHNDPKARTLIQEISRTAYQHFKAYMPRPLISNNEQVNDDN